MRWAASPATIAGLYYHDGLSGEFADVAVRRCPRLAGPGAGLRRPHPARRPPRRRPLSRLQHPAPLNRRGRRHPPSTRCSRARSPFSPRACSLATRRCHLLQTLRGSQLYRADQHSYILYPDRELPGFLHKNQVAPHTGGGSRLGCLPRAARGSHPARARRKWCLPLQRCVSQRPGRRRGTAPPAGRRGIGSPGRGRDACHPRSL